MTRSAARRRPLAAALAACCAAPVLAQPQELGPRAAPPSLVLQPSVSIGATLTDNRRLTRDGEGDAVTEARAAVHAAMHRGRVRGFVDYGITGLAYARESELNDVRHSLASALSAEVVPRHGFLDVRGSVQQGSASAFGTQSLSISRGDGNRVETATGSVSPYWIGRLGRFAEYTARYSLLATNSRGTDLGDKTTRTGQVRLAGQAGRWIDWALDGSHQRVDYVLGRETVLERVEATLGARPDPDWTVAVFGGRDRSNLTTIERESHSTYGLRTRWAPTERTHLDAQARRTFYGNTHAVSLAHRTRRTAWLASLSRDMSASDGQASVRLGTAYELLFQQFATIERDAALRDVLVREFLAARGIDPNVEVNLALLVSAVTLQRERSLAFSWVGLRATATLLVSRNQTTRLSTLDSGAALGDLAGNEAVRQDHVALNIAHRLTPTSSLHVLGGWNRSRGDAAGETNILRTALVTWASQPNPRSALAVTLRRSQFGSRSSAYDENAVMATFTRHF